MAEQSPDRTGDWRPLVDAATHGDAEARDELVRRYEPRVRSIVHRELESDFRRSHSWMLPVFSTRDVVQDVFVGLMQALDAAGTEFPNEGAFVTYLATMVRHRLLDAVRFHEAKRRDARRAVGSSDDDAVRERADEAGPVPELAAQLAEHATLLRAVLDELPERHRALVRMRIVEGLPYAEVATALGYASEETARQACVDVQTKLLIKLRARGVRPPGETLT